MPGSDCRQSKPQVKTAEKSNEITAILELLAMLDIKSTTVTIDAIGCQKEIVKQIVKKKKAGYLIALKRNQENLYNELSQYAQDCIYDSLLAGKYQRYSKTEKGHGRIETRKYYLFNDISWYEDIKDWVGLRSVLMVQSKRQVGDQLPTYETRYCITSLTDINMAANAARKHWGIENNLHWVLDVTFKEDAWHTRKETAAANLSQMRRLTTNILKADTSVNLTSPMKRYQCSLSPEYLNHIVFDNPVFS